MDFVGRRSELAALRAMLDRPDGSLIRVPGLKGGGKSALVELATRGLDRVLYRAPPLPEPRQQDVLAAALRGSHDAVRDAAESSRDTWARLFRAMAETAHPGDRPRVLVIDDINRLSEARARWTEPLANSLLLAASERRPFHVILVGPRQEIPWTGGLPDLTTHTVEVHPLSFRSAAPVLPGARPRDLLRAYAVFGGIPSVLRRLDRTVTVGTNIRRLLLEPGEPLAELAAVWLEQAFQAPTRYYAIMAALAEGEATWAAVHAGVPGLTTSGQVAPYLKRLEERGWVRTRRSLDAGKAARARRYRITDPFLAFWFRFLLPPYFGPKPLDPRTYYAEAVRPLLSDHVDTILPSICRRFMTEGASEILGADAREAGSLWGSDYDLDVAGTLTSGASFYGHCFWEGPPKQLDALARLDAQLRETRYGFGREARLRLIFTGRPLTRRLQRDVARRADTLSIGPDELLGSA